MTVPWRTGRDFRQAGSVSWVAREIMYQLRSVVEGDLCKKSASIRYVTIGRGGYRISLRGGHPVMEWCLNAVEWCILNGASPSQRWVRAPAPTLGSAPDK